MSTQRFTLPTAQYCLSQSLTDTAPDRSPVTPCTGDPTYTASKKPRPPDSECVRTASVGPPLCRQGPGFTVEPCCFSFLSPGSQTPSGKGVIRRGRSEASSSQHPTHHGAGPPLQKVEAECRPAYSLPPDALLSKWEVLAVGSEGVTEGEEAANLYCQDSARTDDKAAM